MPRQLIPLDPREDAFPFERMQFIEQVGKLLGDYAFFDERARFAELAAQLNTETSKYERGFLMGYVHAVLTVTASERLS